MAKTIYLIIRIVLGLAVLGAVYAAVRIAIALIDWTK